MKQLKKIAGIVLVATMLFSQTDVNGMAASQPSVTETLTVAQGEKKTITVQGETITDKLFESSNSKIATVSQKGVVTGKKAGNCKVTVTVTYRKNKKSPVNIQKKFMTKITVKKTKKNAGDVKALKQLIKEQSKLGAKIRTNIDSSQYKWNKKNGKLTGIYWGECNLQEDILLPKLTGLKEFSVYGNQLSTIDAGKCTALVELACQNNQLTSLHVNGCKNLKHLLCENNQLTSLDVSNCTLLANFYCNLNQLSEVNVSNCTLLENFECMGNALKTLDVSSCTALTSFCCASNQLSKLDVRNCKRLGYLDCSVNQLKKLDVSKCTALSDLSCNANLLKTLNLTKNKNLSQLSVDRDVMLKNVPKGCVVNR